MPRIVRFSLFAVVVLASIWTAKPAGAQEKEKGKTPPAKSEPSAKTADSVYVSVADVERAAQQLAAAVHEAVRKATEDPAVKVAALKVAKNAVVAAQIAVTQQADALQAVLDALAREIAQASEKQQAKAKRP